MGNQKNNLLHNVSICSETADEAISMWLSMFADVYIANINVGHALKRDFFLRWLSSAYSSNKRWYSDYLERIAFPLYSYTIEKTSSDILFLVVGRAEREKLNIDGLAHYLPSSTITETKLDTPKLSSFSGLRKVFYGHMRFAYTVHQLKSQHLNNVDFLEDVCQAFGLPDTFIDWYTITIERLIWNYVLWKDALSKINTQVLVSAGENLPTGYIFHMIAQELGISSVAIQHGFIGQYWLHSPVWSDNICVWGQVEYDWYLEQGVAPSRVTIAGNPRGIVHLPIENRESLREKMGYSRDDIVVVWFTTHRGEKWGENFTNWLNTLLSSVSNIQVILKLHPIEKPEMFSNIDSENVKIVPSNAMTIDDAFLAGDIIIHDFSSIGAEAHRCGHYVICAALNPPYPSYYEQLIGPQHLARNPDELVDAVKQWEQTQLEVTSSPCLGLGGDESRQAIAEVIASLLSDT